MTSSLYTRQPLLVGHHESQPCDGRDILYHTVPYSTIFHHTLPYSMIFHHIRRQFCSLLSTPDCTEHFVWNFQELDFLTVQLRAEVQQLYGSTGLGEPSCLCQGLHLFCTLPQFSSRFHVVYVVLGMRPGDIMNIIRAEEAAL